MNNFDINILFENKDIIVIDKDRQVPVHGGRGIDVENTLTFRVKQYLKMKTREAQEFITPAHRLDLNTRGPVFYAKNHDSAVSLNRAFSSGNVFKTYQALLEGVLESDTFIQADIIKNSHKKAVVKNTLIKKEKIPSREEWLSSKDKNSRTISATIIFPVTSEDRTTLCRIETWTGRYHQIRAVCEAFGYPVCGDKKYNHNPVKYYHRVINKKYPDGQMLLCKSIRIPSLGIAVTSNFDLII